MRQIITARLKLNTAPEQFQLLRQIQLAYRDVLNYVSRYAFEHGKISEGIRLQKGTYRDIRKLFHLQKTERESPRLLKQGMKCRSLYPQGRGNARIAGDCLDPGCKTRYTSNTCSSMR